MISVWAGISATAERNSWGAPNGSLVPCTNTAGTRSRGKCSMRNRVWLTRRMQGVGEHQQHRRHLGFFCGKHRGLPSAIGLPAENYLPRHQLVHRLDSASQAVAVGGGRRRRRRPRRPPLAKRQIAAQHRHTLGAEGLGGRDQ